MSLFCRTVNIFQGSELKARYLNQLWSMKLEQNNI